MARQAVHDHWGRDLTPEERAATDMVVDLDADETTCPACMSAVPGGSARCPSCGLRFS